MKSLMLALALITSFNSNASTIDGYSLPINGQQSVENFILNTVQTRTESRLETQANTCYRTVFAGNDRICHQQPITNCWVGRNGTQICNTQWVNQCFEKPRYREESYTCYKTVSIPFEVFSNNVQAKVNVKLPTLPAGSSYPNNRCDINFTLNGGDFNSKANCSEFIVIAKSFATESRSGQTVTQDRQLDISLLDADYVTSPVNGGIGEMRMEGQTLIFSTGNLNKNKDFSLKLFVERKKFLKSDEELINRNLAPQEYSFTQISDDRGIVRIDLQNLLSGIDKGKKHVIIVDINVLTNISNSINTHLPTLSTRQAIIVNE